jgi:hypothetical protein
MKSIILITITLAGALFAQEATPGVTKRQTNQQKRIAEGVADGSLTKKETIRLEKQQRELRKDKRAAKADGVGTAEERKDLHQDQNKMSRRIRKQKNDAQTQKP